MSHDYTHYGLSATRRTGLNDRSNIPNQTLSKKVSPLDFEHIHWAIHLRLKPIWVLIKMKDRFFCFSFWGCICLKWKIWYLILIVGQFGTGQFGTGQFGTGQFGTLFKPPSPPLPPPPGGGGLKQVGDVYVRNIIFQLHMRTKRNLTSYELSWTLRNTIEHYWTLLNTIGHYWTLLNTLEHYWTLLNTIEHYWTLLNTLEHYWTLLNTIEHYWTLLNTIEH